MKLTDTPDTKIISLQLVTLWHNRVMTNRPFALWGHVTSFLWKVFLWFCFQKTMSGSCLKQNNSDLVFQTRAIFLKWVSWWLVTWPKHEFEIMNYFFRNTKSALKLQGKCWKDDVLTFTAHLSITIKRLTRYKQKVIFDAMLEGILLPSNMVANKSYYFVEKTKCHKISPLNVFPLKFRT